MCPILLQTGKHIAFILQCRAVERVTTVISKAYKAYTAECGVDGDKDTTCVCVCVWCSVV